MSTSRTHHTQGGQNNSEAKTCQVTQDTVMCMYVRAISHTNATEHKKNTEPDRTLTADMNETSRIKSSHLFAKSEWEHAFIGLQ